MAIDAVQALSNMASAGLPIRHLFSYAPMLKEISAWSRSGKRGEALP
jgi:hypothetical protein